MAIIIPHRFVERLLPSGNVQKINTIVLGTFNPGTPVLAKLTPEELSAFEQIARSPKFVRFSLVKNYYDRPANRLWKVFDIMDNPTFYEGKPLRTRNPHGLKFYSRMSREEVFKRQQEFCLRTGIFITDLVRSIAPSSFHLIYDQFADKAIEKSVYEWNTEGILQMVEKFRPKRILINFKVHPSIPEISKQVVRILDEYPELVRTALSTSGAAGNDYLSLYQDWSRHIVKD